MLAAGIITLIMFIAILFVARSNRRAENAAVAKGLCPVCDGAGADYIMMNGLEGCWGCASSGTLDGHNAYRRSLNQRELSA